MRLLNIAWSFFEVFDTSENYFRLLRSPGHFRELFETSENCFRVLRTGGYFQDFWEVFNTSRNCLRVMRTVRDFRTHCKKKKDWKKIVALQGHYGFGSTTTTTTEILLFLVSCGIIAMSCSTSYTNDLRDIIVVSFSYDWAYEIGWTYAAVAIFGSIISSTDLFMLARHAGNPTMSFKSDSFLG